MSTDGFTSFPELGTPRLRLREITPDDAQWYLEHFSTPEIVHGSGFPAPRDIDAARKEMQEYIFGPFENATGLRWGIALKGESRLTGSCGFYGWVREGHDRCDIGYDLNPAFWNRGIMEEALRAMIRFGFEEMHLNRIQATVMARNQRSIKVLKSQGFTIEGKLREYSYFDGERHDEVMLSLLRRDGQPKS
jgi:ribosomal-protein-alanine N-acetyltransferase